MPPPDARPYLYPPDQDVHLYEDPALTAIAQLLDGQAWTADTLQQIAEIMRAAGFVIRDLNDLTADEDSHPQGREER